jgi:hypothetical protein
MIGEGRVTIAPTAKKGETTILVTPTVQKGEATLLVAERARMGFTIQSTENDQVHVVLNLQNELAL